MVFTREQRLEHETLVRTLMATKVRTRQLQLVAGPHRTQDGVKLEFSDHYYMIEIFQDSSPEVAVQSSVQTGKTEYLTSYGKACVDNGLAVLHVLPRYESRNTFVGGRIDPVLQDVPEYRTTLRRDTHKRASDNKSIKLFQSGGVWRFVSSNVRADFKEYSADVLIADELDEFDMENFGLANDRLEASSFKFKRWCGNPTVPGYGINELFEAGTQKVMHYCCTGCDKWQRLDFFRCVAESAGDGSVEEYRLREGIEAHDEFVCEKCGCALDRLTWRWIPLHPNGAYASYQISKLLSRSASPKRLWEQYLRARAKGDAELQIFYNSVLGVPFAPSGSAITEDMIKAASLLRAMPHSISSGWCTMGGDVGRWFDVRISKVLEGVRCAMHIDRCRSTEELMDLVKRYRVRCAVLDALPETRKVKEFQAAARKVHCDVWLCRFQSSEGHGSRLVRNEAEREFTVDRTYAMDENLAQLRDLKDLLPVGARGLLDGGWLRAMTVNKRTLLKDARGNLVYRWTKAKDDHQRFASVYDMLAGKIMGTPAADAKTIDEDESKERGMLLRGGQIGRRDRKFLGSDDEGESVLGRRLGGRGGRR